MVDEIKRAKDAAYRSLSYRQRSRKELTDKLKEKKFSDKVIEDVIQGLEEYNYINDADFAFNWAESRVRTRRIGPIILRSELLKKGISKDIVDKTLKEIYNKYNERLLAIDALNSKAKMLRDMPENKKKRRLYSFLMQKGFSYEIINEILGEMEIEIKGA